MGRRSRFVGVAPIFPFAGVSPFYNPFRPAIVIAGHAQQEKQEDKEGQTQFDSDNESVDEDDMFVEGALSIVQQFEDTSFMAQDSGEEIKTYLTQGIYENEKHINNLSRRTALGNFRRNLELIRDYSQFDRENVVGTLIKAWKQAENN